MKEMFNKIFLILISSAFLPAIVLASDEVTEPHWVYTVVANFLPLVMIIALWIFFMRRWGGAAGKDYISRARRHMDKMEESNRKQEELLGEIVSLLKGK